MCDLMDYEKNEYIREATRDELLESRDRPGGVFHLDVRDQSILREDESADKELAVWVYEERESLPPGWKAEIADPCEDWGDVDEVEMWLRMLAAWLEMHYSETPCVLSGSEILSGNIAEPLYPKFLDAAGDMAERNAAIMRFARTGELTGKLAETPA